MTMAGNLTSAATLTYAQASLGWYALTLKAKFAAFIEDVSPLFPDGEENNRPVGNWLIPMYALSKQLTSSVSDISLSQFNELVTYVFKMCYSAATAQAQNRISNTQATAMLAAWNARFGT